MFRLSAAQRVLQLLYTLPCAVTLLEARSHAWAGGVMLLSKSGPTDCVRIPACRPVASPVGNSCEAGSRCFATTTGAAPANAAPDLV